MAWSDFHRIWTRSKRPQNKKRKFLPFIYALDPKFPRERYSRVKNVIFTVPYCTIKVLYTEYTWTSWKKFICTVCTRSKAMVIKQPLPLGWIIFPTDSEEGQLNPCPSAEWLSPLLVRAPCSPREISPNFTKLGSFKSPSLPSHDSPTSPKVLTRLCINRKWLSI